MNKTFFFIIRATVLSLFPFLLIAQEARLTADYPTTISAGETFLMAVRVEKGPATGAAKLQFDLPAGFTAKKVNSRSGDFIFENNTVKLIWSNLPESQEFTISFNLIPAKSLIGKQTITGEFVYLNGDQSEHVSIRPCIINIANTTSSNTSSKNATPKVERKIVTISEQKGEYNVALTFYPNSVSESAQFTDVLPPDYSALIIDAHEASYSFENQSVIFTWEKFPTEKSFTISYLVKSTSPNVAMAPVINGTLFYGDALEVSPQTVSQLTPANNYTQPNPVNVQTPVNETQKETLNADNTGSTGNDNTKEPQDQLPVANSGNEVNTEAPKEQLAAANTGTTGNEVNTEAPKEQLAVANTSANSISDNTSANANTTAENITSENTDGSIYFKIQICATKKSPAKNSAWFEQKYKVDPPVEMTLDEGWKKYLIGNFKAFKDAKEFKNLTREKVSDAFIVAYQNGKRIPVSDALRNKAINQ